MIAAWFAAHVQAFRGALRKLKAQPFASALSIVVIAIAVMLPLGFFVIFETVNVATAHLDAEPTINIYLEVGASEADAREAGKRLAALANTQSVKFISRDSALAEMKRLGSIADLLAGLDSNPLPHAFAVQPKSTDSAVLKSMQAEISSIPRAERVVMDFEWVEKLRRFGTFASRIAALLTVVLGLAVVFVTGNTIRLQMLTQKEEIEVSRLIGATNRYIRRPFLYFGLLQGLLAGILAICALALLMLWASNEVRALTSSYGTDFSAKYFSTQHILAVILGTASLGWLGAFGSVSLYLWRQPGD